MADAQKPKEATAQEKLTLAYGIVFGRDGEHRTPAQEMVCQTWQEASWRAPMS